MSLPLKHKIPDKPTVPKIIRVPIDINAKIGMKAKYMRGKGEKIKIPDLIVRMLNPDNFGIGRKPKLWNLDNDMYVLKSHIHIPRRDHEILKKKADALGLTDEMFIINVLNNQIK